MASTAAASQRSWASMNCLTSSRSGFGFDAEADADQSSRCDGRCRLRGGPGSLEGAVGRGDAGVEGGGRVVGRPAENVAQHERGALAGRQQLKGGDECQFDGLAFDHDGLRADFWVVAGDDLVQQPVGVGLQPWDLGERVQLGHLPRTAPDRVQADVGGDAVEPGPDERLALEALAAAPRPQVGLLHGVCGLVEGRQHAVAVDVQLAPVAPGKLVEG